MKQALSVKRRILLLSIMYGLLFLFPALFGLLLSFEAQPGGITQSNAFRAPFSGPLEPDSAAQSASSEHMVPRARSVRQVPDGSTRIFHSWLLPRP